MSNTVLVILFKNNVIFTMNLILKCQIFCFNLVEFGHGQQYFKNVLIKKNFSKYKILILKHLIVLNLVNFLIVKTKIYLCK